MEFTITMAATTVALATSVALVYSEARRADAERALRIAVERLGRAEKVVAELSELEGVVDDLWRSHNELRRRYEWASRHLKGCQEFIVTKCLVQRPSKGRRWFTRIDRVLFKDAVVAELRHDDRFPTWEHELWGEDLE